MRLQVVTLFLALVSLTGCLGGTGAARADALTIHADWSSGVVAEDSLERMRDAIATLGGSGADNYRAMIALCRLSVGSPSELVRADALRAAWEVGARMPSEPYRVDPVDHEIFNQRAQRLDELLEQNPGALDAPSPELIELVDWVGSFRFPPGRLLLALDLADAVTSRALAHDGTVVGAAFDGHAAASLRHALALATLHAAGDSAPIVREEAATAARHLPLEAAHLLLAAIVTRETDGQVLFRGLDSLETILSQLAPQDAQRLLSPLMDDLDVAVRQRARELAQRIS